MFRRMVLCVCACVGNADKTLGFMNVGVLLLLSTGNCLGKHYRFVVLFPVSRNHIIANN